MSKSAQGFDPDTLSAELIWIPDSFYPFNEK
jgi:hypothetical protein